MAWCIPFTKLDRNTVEITIFSKKKKIVLALFMRVFKNNSLFLNRYWNMQEQLRLELTSLKNFIEASDLIFSNVFFNCAPKTYILIIITLY